MEHRYCWRCGKELFAGNLTYVVQVRVFADFDGLLVEPPEGVDEALKRLLKQIERADPRQLEKEVYEEFSLLLCKSCRDRFADEIEHPWEGPLIRRDPGRTLH